DGICPSPYTFEHLPGHVLMGFANEVMQAGSVEECLSACLIAKKEMEMECMSAMYYYDTGECILNDKNRATNAAAITNDTMNMRVDYFENRCFDDYQTIECLTDFVVHWIKVEKFIINNDDSFDYTVIKQENKIDEQPFPCKLYAYNELKMTCHLTSKSALAHSTTTTTSVDDQKMPDDWENCNYYEKICLKGGSIECQESSFEHISNHALLNIENTIVATSMAGCLEICLHAGKQCSSVMFFHDKVDYFDNVCDYKITVNMSVENKIIKMPPKQAVHKQLNGTKNLGLETECGAAGISVSVLFTKPTTGAIFLKDHFATCRFEFNNALNATMQIALSTLRQDNPPCPGYETKSSTWSFIVVVQKNGMEVPGLMTDEDLIFNITCDYSNDQTIKKTDRIIISSHHRLLQDAARDWLSIPASNDHVQLTVLRGDQPVSTAAMGEELEMRWTMVQNDVDNVELFVNQCIAERLDGIPPLPPPLTLIADGCIDSKVKRLLMQHPIVQFDGGLKTKIKVFRFDGSRRVRILCAVDICVEGCLPVACDKEVSNSLANSDKKKREALTSWTQQTTAQRIKRELITGTFTIVEEDAGLVRHENETTNDEQSLNQYVIRSQFPENNHFCIERLAFVVLIAIALLLLTMQTILIYKYLQLKTQRSHPSGTNHEMIIYVDEEAS
ncbi:unnamed protein product, partial [Litomosoides sigmodontis]